MSSEYVDFESSCEVISEKTLIKDIPEGILFNYQSNYFDSHMGIFVRYDEFTFVCKNGDKLFVAFGFDTEPFGLSIDESVPEYCVATITDKMLGMSIDEVAHAMYSTDFAPTFCKVKKYRGRKVKADVVGISSSVT